MYVTFCVTTGPVRPGPDQPAAHIRQLSPGVPLTEPWRFRVMSYNILADQYAGTSYAQQVRGEQLVLAAMVYKYSFFDYF